MRNYRFARKTTEKSKSQTRDAARGPTTLHADEICRARPEPFADAFAIAEDHVRHVLRYLAEKRDAKQRVTLYELEDHFGVHGAGRSESEAFTRGKRGAIVRYFTVHDADFEAGFWRELTNGEAPSESLSLTSPLEAYEISPL